MTTSPKAVRFDEDTLWVSLSDGRTIAAPLAWFPRLLEAAPEQRAQVELSKGGLHWMRWTKIFPSLAYWPGNRICLDAQITSRRDIKCSRVTLDASFVSASSRLQGSTGAGPRPLANRFPALSYAV